MTSGIFREGQFRYVEWVRRLEESVLDVEKVAGWSSFFSDTLYNTV